jgi:hypothetical protein
MKLFLASLVLALGLSIPAAAELVPTPNMAGDNPSLDYAGVSACRITSADSTNGKVCTSNPALVYGVSISSVAATSYVMFYSTNSAALAGATPVKLQWNDNSAADEDVTATQDYKWIAPLKFVKGLTVKMSAAVTAGEPSEVVIFYREIK